jgi:hypothetical protein
MTRRSAGAWRGLSPSYRARLVRVLGEGDVRVARRRYLAGESLQFARGKRAGEYAERVRRGVRRRLSRTQAAGRPRPGEHGASQSEWTFPGVPVRQADGTALVDVAARRWQQASRLGRYQNDVRELLYGRLPATVFQSRWRRRQIAGVRVESDPDRVIEAIRQQGPEPGIERYRRTFNGRPV